MSLTLEQQIFVLDQVYPDKERTIDSNGVLHVEGEPVDEQELETLYPSVNLDYHKAKKYKEIESIRDMKLYSGLEHDFNGTIDVIQTRIQDKFNLLGIHGKALALKGTVDETEKNIVFRALSNTEYLLNAQEASDMCLAAYDYIEKTYVTSWQLKHEVEIATTISEVEAISWPEKE